MAKKKIRMLVDHPIGALTYRCNVVVECEASMAAALVKEGVADDSKAAVEYALKESGGDFLVHADAVVDPQDGSAGTDGSQQ